MHPCSRRNQKLAGIYLLPAMEAAAGNPAVVRFGDSCGEKNGEVAAMAREDRPGMGTSPRSPRRMVDATAGSGTQEKGTQTALREPSRSFQGAYEVGTVYSSALFWCA